MIRIFSLRHFRLPLRRYLRKRKLRTDLCKAPCKAQSKGTATVGRGVVQGAGQAGQGLVQGSATVARGAGQATVGVAKGTGTVATKTGRGAWCIITLGYGC
jgi:hypothetical protein